MLDLQRPRRERVCRVFGDSDGVAGIHEAGLGLRELHTASDARCGGEAMSPEFPLLIGIMLLLVIMIFQVGKILTALEAL